MKNTRPAVVLLIFIFISIIVLGIVELSTKQLSITELDKNYIYQWEWNAEMSDYEFIGAPKDRYHIVLDSAQIYIDSCIADSDYTDQAICDCFKAHGRICEDIICEDTSLYKPSALDIQADTSSFDWIEWTIRHAAGM